ncbi:hypothetical protein V2G26_019123 [Clonostachys chloroleuca]
MGHIYRNAYATICSLSSDSCERGFLKRNPSIYVKCYLRSVAFSYRIIWYCELDPTFNNLDNWDQSYERNDKRCGRWFGRGWALQELLLSPRAILFTKGRLYFRSERLSWTENEADTPKPPFDIFYPSRLSKLDKTYPSGWLQVICDYTKKSLTNPWINFQLFPALQQPFRMGNRTNILRNCASPNCIGT